MMYRFLIFILSFSSLTTVGMCQGNWPDYRGPSQDGHSQEKGLPLKWSESKNVVWKTPIHGRAWSSPVVWGNQVWLTTATKDGKSLSAICVDRKNGKILLDRVLFKVEKPRPLGNTVNTYGSPSPVIEEGRVYIHFGSYGTACLDTKTFKEIWQRRDLPCNHFRGPASSPILFEDLIIFHMDGSDHHYIVALNKKTGDNVWKTPRSTDYGDLDKNGKPKRDGDFRKAYNTPILIKADGKLQLISPAAKAVYSYNPRTGKEYWQVRYPGHSTASRTVVGDNLAFVNSGYAKAQLWAVKLDGKGEVTKSHVEWKYTKSVCNRSSPIYLDGYLYFVNDKGIAGCLEAKTGREVWRGRLGGNYSACPVLVDGKIYFFSEEGKTSVVQPGKELKILAENELDDGFMASPAVAGGAFFLRTRSHLYRIEK